MPTDIRLDEAGFRIRAEQPTRVEAFVDAAFAFAVTLLVVAVGKVPDSVGELVHALRGVPAFAASFLLIARFWRSHRQWSRRYALEDDYSVHLSLALVFMILVYVYPLRMVANMAFAGFSGGALAEKPAGINNIEELRELYVIFAIGYVIVVGIFVLLHRHALMNADAIGLSPLERLRTRYILKRYLAGWGVAMLSLVLALGLTMSDAHPLLYALPGMVYMLISPLMILLRRRERAAIAALASAPA